MKCLRNPIDGTIKRVSTHEARRLASYGWTYVSKGEWKRSVRPNLAAIRAGVSQATGKLIAGTSSSFRRLG